MLPQLLVGVTVIIAPLALIVWWEYKRARQGPQFIGKFREGVRSGIDPDRIYIPPRKSSKRAFDSWQR